MIEEIHEFFKELFDWCFPELRVWEVSEYSDGVYMIFTTVNRHFTISVTKWTQLTEKEKHLMKIKLVHNVLNHG